MALKINRDAVNSRLAKLLRIQREKKNLSMTGVAERAGLSQQMVSYIEREMRKPTLDTFLRITEVLEADPVKLLEEALRGLSDYSMGSADSTPFVQLVAEAQAPSKESSKARQRGIRRNTHSKR